MNISSRKLSPDTKVTLSALILSLGLVCSAATTSIQVQTTVGEEGNGQENNNPSGGGIILPIDATPPAFLDVEIYDITQTSAKVSFRTKDVCLAELRYGHLGRYESGPLAAHLGSYEKTHEFLLTDLVPGEKYYLYLTARNQKGVTGSDRTHNFITLPEFTNLPNVGALSATQSGKQVVLSWKNPADERFTGVEIRRQAGVPALTLEAGEKVYAGTAERFVDPAVVDKKTYFYTVFSLGADGLSSSGATISVTTSFVHAGSGSAAPVPSSDDADDGAIDTGTKLVPDLTNFLSVPEKSRIVLSWECPAALPDCWVELRRNTDFPSTNPAKGDLVYSGLDSSFADSGVNKGRMYFYTAYVKDAAGDYSKGRMVASQLGKEMPGSSVDLWSDVAFVDVRSSVPLEPGAGEKITTISRYELGISVQVPQNKPKRVVAEMGGVFYNMGLNVGAGTYETSFMTGEPGLYELRIDFLDADGGVIFRRAIDLELVAEGMVFTMENEGLFGSGLTPARFVCRLGNIFGWYDEACMREKDVAGATVRVLEKEETGGFDTWVANNYKQSNPSLTDKAGRYGFVVPNGEYIVSVRKDGYEAAEIRLSVANNTIVPRVKIHILNGKSYGIIFLIVLAIIAAFYLKKRLKYMAKNKGKT